MHGIELGQAIVLLEDMRNRIIGLVMPYGNDKEKRHGT